MVSTEFLRSINIQLDVGHPDRLEHFRPTSKSIRLISSLVKGEKGNAVFVVAPYGSGKSITSGYIGELTENRDQSSGMLEKVEARIKKVDTSLGNAARRRRKEGKRGLFVPLYGHVRSTPSALKEGILASMRRCKLGRQARTIQNLPVDSSHDLFELLSVVSEKLESSDYDRLVIVWDEFGRHLQGLISEGRPEDLDVLQVLAELVSRTTSVPVSLALLLHRSLLGYAGSLPSGVKREWAKIEGRFETLQYLDDSTELYELVSSLVKENRQGDPEEYDSTDLARRSLEVGLFPDLKENRLREILMDAFPLEPTTLHLLPRVAARVAQNERTIFSFLQWVSLEEPVPAAAIYDYFRGDFRTDGGPGGTQRPWLETESALQKVESGSLEEDALKSAFLLSLGLSGERSHATYAQVAFSLEASEVEEPEEVLNGLIDRKLLVHRRHSDQLVVWHGTDVDLRGRLEDEKKRTEKDFQLASFLSRELPPPVWRPVEYNARRGIRRYFTSEYTTVDGLKGFLEEFILSKGWEPGCDGKILYVLPDNDAQLSEALEIARDVDDSRLVVAIGAEVSSLKEAALDLWCLLRMHADHDLIGSDPMVKAELDHLTDDARTGLQPLVDRVLRPQQGGSNWYHGGERLSVSTVPQLRRALSQIMEEVFPLTPEIESEMVVRRSPTSVVINARKKVELGILERYGKEDVGIEGHFADRAIFRCVFVRTGLYHKDDAGWRFLGPEELEAPGLSAVWTRIQDFFSMPGEGKSFRKFIDELREPPYGVRDGLIPLFLAAGARAFPTAIAIRKEGRFVEDLLPSVIEDLARNPGNFLLDVVGLSESEQEYLRGILQLFGEDEDPQQEGSEKDGDLLRACLDAVMAWHHDLPPAVSESRLLSAESRAFEKEIRTPDPVRLFLHELPRLTGVTTEEPGRLLEEVKALRDELGNIERVFEEEAKTALQQTLLARGVRNGAGVREQAARWASNFPKAFRKKLPDRVTQGVLMRLGARYRQDGALVNALSSLLVGRTIRQWDDSVVIAFRRQLRSSMDVIEGTALEMSRASDLDPELKAGLVALAEAKVQNLGEHLSELLGREEAAKTLEQIASVIRIQEQERQQ